MPDAVEVNGKTRINFSRNRLRPKVMAFKIGFIICIFICGYIIILFLFVKKIGYLHLQGSKQFRDPVSIHL